MQRDSEVNWGLDCWQQRFNHHITKSDLTKSLRVNYNEDRKKWRNQVIRNQSFKSTLNSNRPSFYIFIKRIYRLSKLSSASFFTMHHLPYNLMISSNAVKAVVNKLKTPPAGHIVCKICYAGSRVREICLCGSQLWPKTTIFHIHFRGALKTCRMKIPRMKIRRIEHFQSTK